MDTRKLFVRVAAVGALVAIVVGFPLCAIGSAFVGNVALVDGKPLGQRAVTLADGYVACFLVDVGEGYVLIDACQDPDRIQAALTERNAGPDDVKAVLLTHSHPDHLGGLAAVPDAPVYALASAGPLLAGKAAHEGPLLKLMGTSDTGVRLTRSLADGEKLALGDTVFEVFAVPGHTRDSAVYLAHGVLFMGDTASWTTSDRLIVAPWMFTDDQDQNLASLKQLGVRLKDRQIDWLAPAHTGPAAGSASLQAL